MASSSSSSSPPSLRFTLGGRGGGGRRPVSWGEEGERSHPFFPQLGAGGFRAPKKSGAAYFVGGRGKGETSLP